MYFTFQKQFNKRLNNNNAQTADDADDGNTSDNQQQGTSTQSTVQYNSQASAPATSSNTAGSAYDGVVLLHIPFPAPLPEFSPWVEACLNSPGKFKLFEMKLNSIK
jgi:hypothetical protein